MDAARAIELPCRYYRRYPVGQPLGHAEETLRLPLAETVFLLVDVHGPGFDADAAQPDVSEWYRRNAAVRRDVVVNHICPAKQAARAAGFPAVYLINYLAPSTIENNEWRQMSIRTLNIDVLKEWREPCDNFKFSRVIAPEPGDYLIQKQHYSGFFETHLESLLKELHAHNLVTVGFDAQICLRGTITDALYRNYRVIVLRDCISTNEFADTEEGRWSNLLAVRFIETNIGYTATAEDFIRACRAVG